MLSALITLEVTVEDGHNFNGIYIREGKALVSRLDCYYHNGHCPGTVTTHALAHAYGDMTLANDGGEYDDTPGLLTSKEDFRIWHRRGTSEYAHRFNEYNEDDKQKAYPHFTNRFITAVSGDCIEYDVDDKPKTVKVGKTNASRFKYHNETVNDTINIPESALGREGTTYIYRGFGKASLASAPRVVCGDRCMYIWVYKNFGNTDGPKIYQCPITVSDVGNAELLDQKIPNAVARVAAVSIALQGRYRAGKKGPDFHQYQFYADG